MQTFSHREDAKGAKVFKKHLCVPHLHCAKHAVRRKCSTLRGEKDSSLKKEVAYAILPPASLWNQPSAGARPRLYEE
jgi:hypothetical protein